MRILIISEMLYPMPGNNGNLIGKLIPYLKENHHVEILSMAFGCGDVLPDSLFGVPVHWAQDEKRDWKRRYLYPLLSKIVDRNGFSDALISMILRDKIRQLDKIYHYDVLFTMSEPFVSALASLSFYDKKRILYILDPPAQICDGIGTPYRNKKYSQLIRKQDLVLTTPFISEALAKHNLHVSDNQITSVGFPMITDKMVFQDVNHHDNIRLLFCGWLYSDIRSPQFFLNIISRLDERFEVMFMGRECETLLERFSIETKARIIALPQQPYEAALRAMSDADILINIGNRIPVHMPSKTLEYINTGKAIVNFYKFPDCPTLYYTRRYHLNQATETFVKFCIKNKGKVIDHSWIEQEYRDCTPKYIAKIILNHLEK